MNELLLFVRCFKHKGTFLYPKMPKIQSFFILQLPFIKTMLIDLIFHILLMFQLEDTQKRYYERTIALFWMFHGKGSFVVSKDVKD